MGARAKLRNAPSAEHQRQAITYLVLFLLAFLPYANTLFNNFVYDDGFQVVQNPYVHSFKYLPQIFGTTVWSFQGTQGITNYYRPLMTFGYLLSYQIAGAIPFSFHLVNILLHALAVCLLFWMLRGWSGERVALIAAGLFALHPIHTESVAWIAGVTDLELAVFYLLTFILYLRLSEPRRGKRPRFWMCLSFALALLSKEQAMTLPVLAVLFEHFYREDRAATSLREKFSRYAPLWSVTVLYVAIRAAILGGIASVVSRPGLSWYEVGLSAVALLGSYIGKLLWPAHLSAFYVFHKSSHFADRNVLLALAALAACGFLFAVLWRRAHIISFAVLWTFLTLAPVLNARWMPAGVFGERYLYLPSAGFCWMVGWGMVQLWKADASRVLRPLARAAPAVLATIALLYAVKTVARNRDWRTEETLFRKTLEDQPDASLIRASLGANLFNRGEMDSAEHEFLVALASGPTNVFALSNLGLVRARQHRYAEALEYFRRALRARPVYADGHLNLAETLADMGQNTEAEWQFRIATSFAPLSTRAQNSYGKFLFDSGRLDEARSRYEQSAAAEPTIEAYDQLGDVYAAWREHPLAEQAFRRALALNSFDSHAHFGLATVLEANHNPSEALQEFERGLATDPGDPAARAAVARLRIAVPSPQAMPGR